MTHAKRQSTAIVRINLLLAGALLLVAVATHALAQGPFGEVDGPVPYHSATR